MGDQEYLTVEEIAERIRQRVAATEAEMGPTKMMKLTGPSSSVRLDELRRNVRRATSLLNAVGGITPRPPGLKNGVAQLTKKCIRKALMWLFDPLRQFNSAMLVALHETARAAEAIEDELDMIRGRLDAIDVELRAEGNSTTTVTMSNRALNQEIALLRLQIERMRAELSGLREDRTFHRKTEQG
jgi:hypothetical protein